jgi:dihydroorotate dehydrogenase electron transfer subunit
MSVMIEPADKSCEKPFVQSVARVVAQEPASSRYFLLRLHCPEIAARAKPGQFVMLACSPDQTGAAGPLLPRPLAILSAQGPHIELLYFVAGKGTAALNRWAGNALRAGAQNEPLRIIGPLGNGFEPVPGVEAHVGLGGGSGVAPLAFFFRQQAALGGDWRLVLAARTAEQLVRDGVLGAAGRLHRATDDGSAGLRGNAVDALRALLDNELKGRKVAVYAAGPEPMMQAAAKAGRALSLPVRVSLEQRMACGVGVCRACVVDGAAPHKKTGLLRRTVCQDGPVFDINELAGW